MKGTDGDLAGRDNRKRAVRLSVLLGAAAALLALAGCGDDPYKGVRRTVVHANPVDPADPTLRPYPKKDAGLPEDTIAQKTSEQALDPDAADQRRIARADIYFKFEWAKNVLDTGVVPPDLGRMLDDVRKKSEVLPKDDVAAMIGETITLLEEGLEAHKSVREQPVIGRDVTAGRWPDVRTMPAVARNKKSRGMRGAVVDPLEEAVPTASAKVSISPESPDSVMWKKYRLACAKTEELGQRLGLGSRAKSTAEQLAAMDGSATSAPDAAAELNRHATLPDTKSP